MNDWAKALEMELEKGMVEGGVGRGGGRRVNGDGGKSVPTCRVECESTWGFL